MRKPSRSIRHYAEAINNRGNAFFDLGRFDDAPVSFDRAPRHHARLRQSPLQSRGSALSQLRRHEEGGRPVRAALAIQPEYSDALALLARAHSCNWAGWEDIETRLRTSTRQARSMASFGFGFLSTFDDPESTQRKAGWSLVLPWSVRVDQPLLSSSQSPARRSCASATCRQTSERILLPFS